MAKKCSASAMIKEQGTLKIKRLTDEVDRLTNETAQLKRILKDTQTQCSFLEQENKKLKSQVGELSKF